MPPLPSPSDLKSYLGLTGSQDDALLATVITDAVAIAESDTGRTIASGSNSTTTYSTDGQSSIVIHDRPFTDPSRVVTWMGVTMTEGTNVWFLPDRRDQNITATVQLRYFDTRGEWYKADPNWFDRNLDRPRYPSGAPNDLVITGIIGMPFPDQSVVSPIRELAAWLYWRAKGGASGTITTPTGEDVDLTSLPARYQRFIGDWTIRTAVSSVG